jgi:hypothetical protein
VDDRRTAPAAARDPGAAVIALVPGVLALLPEYASIDDPVPDLRAACLEAVGSLGPRVRIVASAPSGERVARYLVETAGAEVVHGPLGGGGDVVGGDVVGGEEAGVLVVANGSAKRTERAPGHLDERAEAFDETLRELLVGPDPAGLAAIDTGLGAELWADVEGMVALGDLLTPAHAADVHYDLAPFGVQYWVVVWSQH